MIAEACVGIREYTRERMSLSHFISLMCACGLTAGFIKNAVKFNLEYMDYLGYAVAMACASSPELVRLALTLWKGQPVPNSGTVKEPEKVEAYK